MHMATHHFKNVCPRNCYSSCTMISEVENNQLIHISGDTSHPYTKGKLCAKGYAYGEKNHHPSRLKFPYYQEVKGSGKFKQITWKKAFELILCEIMSIHERYENFLPIGLYKYTGNLGVQHFVAEQFFSSIGETTRIVGSPCASAGFEAIQYDMGSAKMSDPSQLKEAKMIILWGSNPAVTNIHLIPFILEAKDKGAKIVVIDPLFTKTAELADMYIQLCPSTDGALSNVLLKRLYESDALDKTFLAQHSFGFDHFYEWIDQMDLQEYLQICGITESSLELLLTWIIEAGTVAHLIGIGLQRHSNGGQNIRAIQALAAAHGDIGTYACGIFFGRGDTMKFTNQQETSNRDIDMNKWITQGQPTLEMMWISCRNPLTQDPNPRLIQEHLMKIPFVVTVEQFMTPTAAMSNLVLPTTTHFEELDIVTNFWHDKIAFNEKALPPYYESRSEWNIMNELAIRLKQFDEELCSFPIYSSEEEYLNKQFNQEIFEHHKIRKCSDLRKKSIPNMKETTAWRDKTFETKTGRYHFYSVEAKKNGFSAIPKFTSGKSPTVEHPFWLLTPHHPYTINSQSFSIDLTDDGEAFVGIHPKVAKMLNIYNGEVVQVYNSQDTLEIKVVYSAQVPEDILLIYQGWYQRSQIIVNRLIPVLETDMGENVSGAKGIAYYDSFVNISKM